MEEGGKTGQWTQITGNLIGGTIWSTITIYIH